ncbi:hypothetical protein MMC30_004772 [Trapelia coarctata]|nr:hypothetical protein [Trapelia coarctata]
MLFLQSAAILSLLSLTPLSTVQAGYLHPRALQVRAYDERYQDGLQARWAEPEASGGPANTEVETANGPEEYRKRNYASCKRLFEKCHNDKGLDPKRQNNWDCQDRYNECVNLVDRRVKPAGPARGDAE